MCFVKKVFSVGTLMALTLTGVGLLNTLPSLEAQRTPSAGPRQTAPPAGQESPNSADQEMRNGQPQQAQAPKPAAPAETPLTEQELVKLVKKNKKQLETLTPTIASRGLDFEMSPDVEQKLRKAGADDNFIANIKNYTPSARAAKQAHGSGPQVTPEEAQAYNQLKDEKDPDKLIQDADAFAQKFPKSQILTYVYALQAGAYEQKNDANDVVKFGEKSLQLDPSNLMSLLMVASVLPQPQMLNVSDA
jgi:hypothetical protein